MALSKAELASHRAQYYQLLEPAQAAIAQGLYYVAIQHALAACEFVDGMMQYERKYEKREFDSVEAIDIILQYAPLVFDLESLNRLAVLLKNQKRIDRHAVADLAEDVERAEKWMWLAYAIWNHVETTPGVGLDEVAHMHGAEDDRCVAITEAWEKMGLVQRRPSDGAYRLTIVTQTESSHRAKCPACGVVGKAPMRKFLEEQTCPKCRGRVTFVMLSHET